MTQIAAWILASVRAGGWAPIAVFLTHMILGRQFNVYQNLPNFDVPMHLMGGVAITYFLWKSVKIERATPLMGTLTPLATRLLVFGLLCASAIVWELAEWTIDSRDQLSLDDTLSDILFGVIGGVAFLLTRRARI